MGEGAAILTLIVTVVGLAQFISTLLKARNSAIDEKLRDGLKYQDKINTQYEQIVDLKNKLEQSEAQLSWYRNQYKVYKAYAKGLKEGRDLASLVEPSELDEERVFDTKPLPPVERSDITNLGEE